MFACYLEALLYSDETIKAMCIDGLILAFADDLLLVSNSWGDLRRQLRLLQQVLEPGGMRFNLKKCEILTARERNQPEAEDDWATDAEASNDEENKDDVDMEATQEKPINVDEWTEAKGSRFNKKANNGKGQIGFKKTEIDSKV